MPTDNLGHSRRWYDSLNADEMPIPSFCRNQERRLITVELNQKTAAEDIKEVKKTVEKILTRLDDLYIKKPELIDALWPLKALVYGFTGIILTGFVGMLVYLVFRR